MPRDEIYLKLYNDLDEKTRSFQVGDQSYFSNYDFFLYKDNYSIGVGIPTKELLHIQKVYPMRRFQLRSRIGLPKVSGGNFLTLSVPVSFDLTDPVRRSLFLDMCMQFVSLEGENREKLLSDPHKWAKEKIEILGNQRSNLTPYPYIAEFHLLHTLLEAGLVKDINQEYRGPEKGVHDFELAGFSLEIKAHCQGDEEDSPGLVTISSESQLSTKNGKPLYLIYYKMEEIGDLSLKSCIDSFGNKREIALAKLESLKKFYENDLYWKASYSLLEALVYPVIGDFPKITPKSFVHEQKPSGVKKLIYTISLANLPCCTLREFIKAKANGQEPEYKTN